MTNTLWYVKDCNVCNGFGISSETRLCSKCQGYRVHPTKLPFAVGFLKSIEQLWHYEPMFRTRAECWKSIEVDTGI